MAAVKTVSLTKEYSNGEHYLRAVDDVSFTVEENEFVAIMGSSGCGKTTLLNLLGGLENPTHGCVYINDVDITQLSMEERSSFRRWHIGFIFQNFNLIPEMNVFENIVLPAKLMERNISKKEVMRIAEELEIEEKLLQNPMTLSGGQQQRVAIARAFLKYVLQYSVYPQICQLHTFGRRVDRKFRFYNQYIRYEIFEKDV